MVGGPTISSGQGHSSKHPGQINLAQLRLQHIQQAAYAQQKQQQQQQQQHQQQIQQQMRIASQLSQQHARQAGPSMVQQQVLKTFIDPDAIMECYTNLLRSITQLTPNNPKKKASKKTSLDAPDRE